MKEHTNNRFVAVLDIMGFKSIVENNPSTLVYDKMKKIYDEAMEVQKYFKLHVTIFSDSIFIITEDDTHESFEDIVIFISYRNNLVWDVKYKESCTLLNLFG